MNSALITLASWCMLFFPLWYGAHVIYYPPGDWIGAMIVSFCSAIGIGALRKARLERRDASLLARPEEPPRDGKRVAIAGTIELTGDPLCSPLSGVKCAAYDYSISHLQASQHFDGKSRTPPRAPIQSVLLTQIFVVHGASLFPRSLLFRAAKSVIL